VKIATFNINNVNRRLPSLLEWLKAAKPDVACLQELKCTDAEFPAAALRKAGYHSVWKGQKTWNGTQGASSASLGNVPTTWSVAQHRQRAAAVFGTRGHPMQFFSDQGG